MKHFLRLAAIGAIFALVAAPISANAQLKKPAITGNLPADIATDINGSPIAVIAGSSSSISSFLTNLADISGAVTLSTQIQGLQDPVGNACWLQLAPVQALIAVHPVPLTLKVASDIEAARLLAIAMNQVCANPNCGQMFVDATNAAAAIAGAPLPFSLQSLCSKVPVIGTSAVATAPAAAAIPAAATK